MVIPWYFLYRVAKWHSLKKYTVYCSTICCLSTGTKWITEKIRSRRSKEKINYDGQPAVNYRLKATALKIAPNSIKRAIRNRRPTSTLVPIEKSVITESRRCTCVFLPLPTTPLTPASGQPEQEHACTTRTQPTNHSKNISV